MKNGAVVASVTKAPGSKLHLEAVASAAILIEGASYDMAAVRIRAVDEFGNVAPYAQLPLRVKLTGAAELVGGECVTLEGGMGGVYVKSVGRAGTAELEISSPQTPPVRIVFEIRLQP